MNLDWTILHWIQDTLVCPALDFLMPKITLLGNGDAVWLLAAAALLITKKYRRYGVLLLVALALGVLTGNLKVHARRSLFERFCHRLCGRRMKSSAAPLLTQDIKPDLVNISIEMRHVGNTGKIVRHILCYDAGDARTDTGRRQILKAF